MSHWTVDLLLARRASGRLFRALICIVLSFVLAVGIVYFLAMKPSPARVFGLSISGDGQNSLPAELAVGQSVLRHVNVINLYVAWERKSAPPLKTLRSIEASGAVPEITWEPWDPQKGLNQPTYGLAEITGGRFDGYLRMWGRNLAGYGGPVIIRFAQEMNGTWYPWSVLRNGGSPTAYAAAFRHVRTTLRQQGAVNIKWVFSPNVMLTDDSSTITTSFPGVGSVDIVGLDGYNFGRQGVPPHAWTSPSQLFHPTVQLVRRMAPNLPIWINETATTQQGGDPIAWVQELFAYARSVDISGVIWFEVGSKSHGPLRLAGTPAAAQAAARVLSNW